MSSDAPRAPDRLRRAAVELPVIVVGIVLALAADRWVAGVDDRGQEIDILTQLAANLTSDFAAIASAIELAERRRLFGARLLEGPGALEVGDPRTFLGDFERVGWLGTLEFSRETWDDLVATGRLALIADVGVRTALSGYYNRTEWIAAREAVWKGQALTYEDRARGVLPARLRLGVLGALPEEVAAPPATSEHVAGVYRALATDSDLRAELGQVVLAYGGQTTFYPRLLSELGELLRLVRSRLDA